MSQSSLASTSELFSFSQSPKYCSSCERESAFLVLKARKDGSVMPRKERIPNVCHMNPSLPFPPHQKGILATSLYRSSVHSGSVSTVVGSRVSTWYLPRNWTNPQGIDSIDSK